jgi:hypothetical protein
VHTAKCFLPPHSPVCAAGLITILIHIEDNSAGNLSLQSTLLSSFKIRMTAHLNDE